MAIPLTGFDDEPSSPVMREETTEKKKPKHDDGDRGDDADPEAGDGLQLRQEGHEEGERERAAEHDRDRDVPLGAAPVLRRRPRAVSLRSRNDARKLSMMVGMRLQRG